MTEEQYVAPANAQVEPRVVARVVDRGARIWLAVLSVLVVMQLLTMIGLGVWVAFTWFGPFGPGYAFDEEAYMAVDQVGMEIAGYVSAEDVEGYMELYREDDPSVKMDDVRDEFEDVIASVESTETEAEYMPDSCLVYTDAETDEKVAQITLSAYDFESGRRVGKRLKLWVLYDELPEIVLTGEYGRDLEDPEMIY